VSTARRNPLPAHRRPHRSKPPPHGPPVQQPLRGFNPSHPPAPSSEHLRLGRCRFLADQRSCSQSWSESNTVSLSQAGSRLALKSIPARMLASLLDAFLGPQRWAAAAPAAPPAASGVLQPAPATRHAYHPGAVVVDTPGRSPIEARVPRRHRTLRIGRRHFAAPTRRTSCLRRFVGSPSLFRGGLAHG
jgi:hypothetical protein